ncbi:MAG: ABC transporter permease [Microbacterium arborescens]
MTGFIGALSEAWAELRHHRLRVLLSLIGIAVAVGAIAGVLALGDYIRQSTAEQSDRYGGREATIAISAFRTDGRPIDTAAFQHAVDGAADRFGFTHVTRRVENMSAGADVQTSDYVRPVTTRLVDVAYPVMHRLPLHAGRWFTDADAAWLAPPVVVSQSLWQSLGGVPLDDHPTLELTGALAGTYRIIGVTPAEYVGDSQKSMTMLADTYLARTGGLSGQDSMIWEVWVGPDVVDEIGPALAAQLRAAAGPGVEVSANRSGWATRPETQQQAQMFELVTGLIAGLVLLLGGLGLVNIQLVAMRQRIREIGVRRSFGATSARIFTSVLLENVVATAVAGVVGIMLAIVTMRTLFALDVLPSVQDDPPFPLRAALIALAAAVAIGAVAGFLPALAAVRSRVIDALRF